MSPNKVPLTPLLTFAMKAADAATDEADGTALARILNKQELVLAAALRDYARRVTEEALTEARKSHAMRTAILDDLDQQIEEAKLAALPEPIE